MKFPKIVALLAVLSLVPSSARADDWDQEYQGWNPEPEGYDVSVDVNPGGVTLDSFQAPLAPYGEWVSTPNHGQVWRPRVASGWRPYYYGRWEWTNEGWLWVSDEPWGWATYHYGRWASDPYYGWIWVPGFQWAPAWVSWRYSGDVIGWAPLGPGLSLYVSTYPFVDFWWTFVPTVRFVSVPVYQVAYAPGYTRQWFHRTAPAPARPAPRPGMRGAPSPSPAWGGPAPRFVSERIGRPLAPARIVAAPSPGARARPGEIPIFRPEARGGAPGRGGFGRGPGAVPAPGGGGQQGGWAPRSDGRGRGPGPAPAPGRGGERGWTPPSGDGRGPGPAPAPGGGRGDDRGERREERRDEHAASPAWRPESHGGGPAAAPPPQSPARGNGGRGERGDRDRRGR